MTDGIVVRMQITHLGHSCVLVETAAARILIDPGVFSDGWHGLTDLDAVLVTHQHPDHYDQAHVPAMAAANRGARWVVEPSVVALLPEAATAEALIAGDSATIGDITVTGCGGRHAVIHPEIPGIGNVGMLLRATDGPVFFHPGDSFAAVPAGADILGLPLTAPWSKVAETVDFGRAVGASHWFPIHDGSLNERGRAMYLDRVRAMNDAELIDLRGGLSHRF